MFQLGVDGFFLLSFPSIDYDSHVYLLLISMYSDRYAGMKNRLENVTTQKSGKTKYQNISSCVRSKNSYNFSLLPSRVITYTKKNGGSFVHQLMEWNP